MSSSKLNLLTTVLILNFMLYFRQSCDSRLTFFRCFPLPLPILILVSSLNESQETEIISMYLPAVERKCSVTWLPLVTIDTDSRWSSSLQNLTNLLRNLGYRKGSPPAKPIFLISAFLRS